MKLHGLRQLTIVTLALVTLNACSGSGGGGGGDNPRNQEEAIAKLSSERKKSFEDWKARIVKSCDASEAFGLSRDHKASHTGVDGVALLNSNGGSVVFTEGDGLVVLKSYNSFSGIGNSRSEENTEMNGQSYSLKAEAKREGSHCVVYLYGQKVYETVIAESFDLGTQWTKGKIAETTSSVPQVNPLGTSGKSEVVRHGFYELIAKTFSPAPKEAASLFARRYQITEDQAAKLFRFDGYGAYPTVRIANEPSAVWSNQEGSNLIAQASVLQNLFNGSAQTAVLEVRLSVPSFSFADVKNSADKGNLKLFVVTNVSKRESTFSYASQTVDFQGLTAFDRQEAFSCVNDRAAAYSSSSRSNRIYPGVQFLFGPCLAFYSDLEAASYEAGLMKSLVPQMFAGVVPSARMDYGGWDKVLSKLALQALESDKDIRHEIDPMNSTVIVAVVSENLNSLKRELSTSKNMNAYKEDIYQMGLHWAFSGETVNASRISYIVSALDNAIDTFQSSSLRLLADLSQKPQMYEEDLAFAKNIDRAYKDEALKALNLSREIGYSDFKSEVFDRTLQVKTSVSEFQKWSHNFAGIKGQISKYGNLGTIKNELIGLSLKWLKSGEVTLESLGTVYAALNNVAVPFEASTKELVQALSQSLGNNKSTLEFAAAIGQEYKQLANSIRVNSRAAGYESWGESFFRSILQKRPSLEQLQKWHEMWTAAMAFSAREKIRTRDEFGSSNDWNLKKVLDIAIEESWSGADFGALEVIAEVARYKNTCDRYQGYSSLADCGGLRLFSRKPGMFFDPARNGRYAPLAKDFSNSLRQLSDFSWTTLRWDLVGTFFGSFEPMWSKCDQGAFEQKATSLRGQLNAIVRESDQMKKWDLEKQIKETLRDCGR